MGDTLEIQRMQQAEAMEQQLDEMWGRGGGSSTGGRNGRTAAPVHQSLKPNM